MSGLRAIVFILLLPFPQVPRALAQTPFADELPAKADLREAIFRYMFKTYDYGPGVKFLCIDAERELPQAFLHRFSGNKVPVVSASECDHSGPMNAIRERKTGRRGLRMTIRSLEFVRGDQARANVETFSDGIAANGNSLELVRKGNQWVIKSDKITGVS